jgi:biopolymer transport protein ExbD
VQDLRKLRWSSNQDKSISRSRADIDRGMIPLINVVFLMLAFLVLAGQIEAHHRKFSVPKSTSDIVRSEEFRTLTVFADGSLEFNDQELQLEQLEQALSQLDLAQPAGNQTKILVVADATLLVHDLHNVLILLQEVGIETVNIATLPARESPP